VVPPHVEYSLTPLGQEVGRHVQGLADWIEVQLPAILLARTAHEAAVEARSAGLGLSARRASS